MSTFKKPWSCENAEESSNTSGQTINVVLSTVPEFEKQPEEVKVNIIEELQFIVRKSAHFIGYMILGILASCLILHYKNITEKEVLTFIEKNTMIDKIKIEEVIKKCNYEKYGLRNVKKVIKEIEIDALAYN